MLYLAASGFEELKIPIEVIPSREYYDSLGMGDSDEPVDGEFLTL
jgi:hypothetical protein